MRILVINGPNLNWLGQRDPDLYGYLSLTDIEDRISQRSQELSANLSFFQSNHEGAIIDFLQANSGSADAIIINPGALTHYGLSLRDALVDTNLPTLEVHLSNIYSREEWRHNSVIAPIAIGQVTGLGLRGYITALEFLVDTLNTTGG
jgi:3-dehydroquinate dehydratase-2